MKRPLGIKCKFSFGNQGQHSLQVLVGTPHQIHRLLENVTRKFVHLPHQT